MPFYNTKFWCYWAWDWYRPYNRRQVAGHPNYQQMISERDFFFKEVVEKSLEKYSKCGPQQAPSMKFEASSEIFKSWLCIPRSAEQTQSPLQCGVLVGARRTLQSFWAWQDKGIFFLMSTVVLAIHNYHYYESLSGEASHLFTRTHLQRTPSQMPSALRRDIWCLLY